MDELAAVAGLVGAGTCLAEKLPGPARGWGPPAVVLAVMALMVCGAGGAVLTAGACAVAGACLWTALAGSPHGRAPAVVDLAFMALLTAGVGRRGAAGSPGHPSGMAVHGAGGAHDPRFPLLVVACWLLAQAGVRLAALTGSAVAAAPLSARAWGRAALREGGTATMVVAMAAMLA